MTLAIDSRKRLHRVAPVAYTSEAALVGDFLDGLKRRSSPWGSLRAATEFDFARGRPDVVALSSVIGVLSFEAKLTRWRDALHQAYRNRCFARRSFVVLPADGVSRALRFHAEFVRRGVGLCVVAGGRVDMIIDAADEPPWQDWLEARVRAVILEESRRK
ncbi:MAG: hypothetical protein IPI67_26740 [Myxococcales bacterium]|nr:hypothetical protein [Myxococcales bacterium]